MRSFRFPFGAAAGCILALAVLAGAWLAQHPIERQKSTLTLWTFAPTHYEAYKEAVPSFEKANPGVKVDLQLVSGPAVTSRLQAAFWSDLDVPDLVEVPIDFAGTFFRGRLENVGFADLTERIEQAGLMQRMVSSRFSPYMSRGRIFGLPHDVHPVMMAYRRDIFEKEGIDADSIKTWDDFIRVGRKLTVPGKRYMLELFDTRDAHLASCLFQRGGGYFTPEGECILDNEISVQTMLWYVPLVAGKDKISNNLGAGQVLTKAVEDGYFVCLLAPDWRTKTFETTIPRVAGKMALMPLPAVEPDGRRTSTWGGTMLGITKSSPDQDLAWKFALHLYLDQQELGERFRGTNIMPALRSAWDQPAFHEPRPYWNQQPIGAMFAKLAPQVPFQYTSPFITTAKAKLGEALVACVQYYNASGDKGFEAFTRARLKKSADELRTLIRRNPY
ncbi:MAG: arabinooligosaccharide transport system substrate-binding protein [Abditibacteriota bacterium]|nr:arabinooligosaccharide transport system substrate-binding protein [Abditibacteriota bacterium]